MGELHATPRDVVARWYASLSPLDISAFVATMHDDIIINVGGRTPVSGSWRGKHVLLNVVLPRVIANLDVATMNLAQRWQIVAVDGPVIVGMMQGTATTLDGETYDQTYCQIFRVEHGLIVESWEFFDTMQAEARLFGKPVDPGSPCADPLHWPEC